MEDKKIARLLISSIIGEDIEDLDFYYNEFTSESIAEKLKEKTGSAYSFTVYYRLDFKAKIKYGSGSGGNGFLKAGYDTCFLKKSLPAKRAGIGAGRGSEIKY
ncbi:MAG: hypothetical protein H7A25_16415 [Leptospiraceae bacterium]|nr:hypothetical protein [Leptospiraceae bacterium]MCP5501487.1 hypothetical protein [Leptospiraceae bacterium]